MSSAWADRWSSMRSWVARAQVADWLDAEYALDEDDEAWVIDAVTGPEIAYEDREILLGGYGIAVQYNA